MKYKLLYPQSYIKRARKLLKKHPEIVKQYEKTLLLLELDPFHPSLRLHQLEGKLKGLSSVSVNISYRIIIEFEVIDQEILLVNIGSHKDVYK